MQVANKLAAVDDLVRRLNAAPVLSRREIERRQKAHRERVRRQVTDEGRTIDEAFGTPAMYRQNHTSFRGLLKSTNDDLGWQCRTVADSFRRYLEIGESPAPYFPMRVAIILRKAKEHARERTFLAAWRRHFRYHDKLNKRAAKLGI